MDERIQHLRHFLNDKKLSAILISSAANIVYFSGFSGFSSIERDGYLLLTNAAGYILTSPLYTEAVRTDVKHLTLKEYSSNTQLHTIFEKLMKKHHLTSVGFEVENLTVAEWKYCKKYLPKLSPVIIDPLRTIKTQQEISHVRTASGIADQAFKKILPDITTGITEKELVFLLENEMRKTTSAIAFPTIAAFGKNAAIPHHKSGETRLKQEDLILIDFGAVSSEYRSDMTRTFFIGQPTAEQKKAYSAVLTAQQKAAAYIEAFLQTKQEIKAAEVDKVARDYLLSQGYPSIPHSLGHGIGLNVHESPRLSPRSKEVLKSGMVFSIEPGVYLSGKFGIRIEDLYAIQGKELIRLTNAPSTLIQI